MAISPPRTLAYNKDDMNDFISFFILIFHVVCNSSSRLVNKIPASMANNSIRDITAPIIDGNVYYSHDRFNDSGVMT